MSARNRHILITGANGFIGRALCAKMIKEGLRVRGAVRSLEYGKLLPAGVETALIGAIGSDTDWSRVLDGVDTVVHLAARAHIIKERSADPISEFRKVNVMGTEHLARTAARVGVRRLIYMSSIGVNGDSTTGIPFTELSSPSPRNAYAASKWEAEQVLHQVAGNTGMEIVILRPPLVYGPNAPGNFARLIGLVKSGLPLPFRNIENMRSFIYVGNLVDAIAKCAHSPEAAGETFLVSDGLDLSTPDLIRLLASAMGKKAKLVFSPPALLKLLGKLTGKGSEVDRLIGSLRIDSSKIKQKLDWRPPFSVERAIKETLG